MISLATELGLILTLPRVLGPLVRYLFKGRVGVLFTAGTVGGGLIVPLFTRLVWKLMMRKPLPRTLNIVTSLMVLGGGLILRIAWIIAGRESADDPQATHYYNDVERRGFFFTIKR